MNVALHFDKLSAGSAQGDDYDVQIINVLGETVKNISVTNTENKININEIPNGVYFVKVTSNGSSFLQKLIVQR